MINATQVVGHDPRTSGAHSTPVKFMERRITIVPAVDVFEDKADITVVADLPAYRRTGWR